MLLSEKNKGIIGRSLLFIATVIWGSSYFIMQDSLDYFPMYFLLSFRFLLGGLILTLIFIKRIIKITKKQILYGVIIGITTALAYIFQTYGLKISASSSKTAFLTSAYCILVPFMVWAFFRQAPSVYNIIAGVACVVGIGFISLSDSLSVNPGDILSFCGAIFFGLQIIFAARFSKDNDPIILTCVYLFTVGIINGVISLIFETGQYSNISFSVNSLLPVLYLMLFPTVVAQACQITGQKFTKPNQAALILSLESVFGAAFGIIFGGDKVTTFTIIGFVIIFFAIIISETKLEFLRKKKNG